MSRLDSKTGYLKKNWLSMDAEEVTVPPSDHQRAPVKSMLIPLTASCRTVGANLSLLALIVIPSTFR